VSLGIDHSPQGVDAVLAIQQWMWSKDNKCLDEEVLYHSPVRPGPETRATGTDITSELRKGPQPVGLSRIQVKLSEGDQTLLGTDVVDRVSVRLGRHKY